jgi:pseudaminic acid synthase
MSTRNMQIGSLAIGPDQPCRVIAEISNAHNGDLDRFWRLLTGVITAGADLVKLQCYTPEELVALRGDGPAPGPWGLQGWTMHQLYEKAKTPHAWFPKIAAAGIPWFSSVFGVHSLTLLEALGCPAYKLASLDYGKRALLHAVRATGKPILRSCAAPVAPKADDLFLYCPEGYPQASIPLRNLGNGYEGFSYHGTNPVIPAVAVAMGATLLEVHVQLDAEPSVLEPNVSLTMTQLAVLVRMVREIEAVCR